MWSVSVSQAVSKDEWKMCAYTKYLFYIQTIKMLVICLIQFIYISLILRYIIFIYFLSYTRNFYLKKYYFYNTLFSTHHLFKQVTFLRAHVLL